MSLDSGFIDNEAAYPSTYFPYSDGTVVVEIAGAIFTNYEIRHGIRHHLTNFEISYNNSENNLKNYENCVECHKNRKVYHCFLSDISFFMSYAIWLLTQLLKNSGFIATNNEKFRSVETGKTDHDFKLIGLFVKTGQYHWHL